MNRTTYPDFQELPSLFLKSCFNGNMHLYVTSNRRYRFKAKLVGDDTFYVTGYDNDGMECGGYNVVRKRPGRIVTRVWPYQDYPQNAPLSIIANRINHDIHVQRVEIGEQTGVFKYQLNEDDWNALVEAVGLEWGMLVVFTRTNLNTLGLMAFHTCGKQATMSKFDGVTNLKKRQHDMTLDEKADESMEHICLWPGYTEHFGERNDTFYKRFSSTLDKQRLAISARLMEKHLYMHLYRKALIRHQKIEFEMKMKMDRYLEKPSRTNHVNIHGKWRQFGKAYGFDYNKMMRVKYMYAVQALKDDQQQRIPVFHVC
ncbi:hypothetical protein Tco_1238890 [Tanacetum coccineum]